jgi:hypothetical protein
MPFTILLPRVGALIAANVAHACEECGGKGKAAWIARELEPKASQLYPDAQNRRILPRRYRDHAVSRRQAGACADAQRHLFPARRCAFAKAMIARIHVNNRLANEETSTHWHGLLRPQSGGRRALRHHAAHSRRRVPHL